jgi:hypothetical protein
MVVHCLCCENHEDDEQLFHVNNDPEKIRININDGSGFINYQIALLTAEEVAAIQM